MVVHFPSPYNIKDGEFTFTITYSALGTLIRAGSSKLDGDTNSNGPTLGLAGRVIDYGRLYRHANGGGRSIGWSPRRAHQSVCRQRTKTRRHSVSPLPSCKKYCWYYRCVLQVAVQRTNFTCQFPQQIHVQYLLARVALLCLNL